MTALNIFYSQKCH